MKATTELKQTAGRPTFFSILQAAVPFLAVSIGGMLVSGVVALFAYANVTDVHARDGRFLIIAIPGFIISFVLGYFAAVRTLAADPESSNGPSYALLKKYGHAQQARGNDVGAGQYKIGEQYLRDLLGRRGA